MAPIDLRRSLNAISDVIHNRPRPLREFDQIFMKAADMLLQVDHISRHFAGRSVIFIGDGDAIALCLVHLHQQGFLENGPERVHVLDFDERVVLSVRRFADQFGIADRITSELYNVADPLPEHLWHEFQAFYSNPPFGASNGGRSVEAFLLRGTEAVGEGAMGCMVIADHPDYAWTQDVLYSTQRLALRDGFVVAELIPQFHRYHLDDAPDLTSCSLVVRRMTWAPEPYSSEPLPREFLANFYGSDTPLRARYVRDLTNGGKLPPKDIVVEPLSMEEP